MMRMSNRSGDFDVLHGDSVSQLLVVAGFEAPDLRTIMHSRIRSDRGAPGAGRLTT